MEGQMPVQIKSMLCGIIFVLLINDIVAAQGAASVSGTYCGTWASRNVWRMTLRQDGTTISASLTGHRPDGVPTSATGSGRISGSQISMTVTFSRGTVGTFSGTFSGGSISARFRRSTDVRSDSA